MPTSPNMSPPTHEASADRQEIFMELLNFEQLKLSGHFMKMEAQVFDRLKAEYVALLDGQTYEYYQEKKDLRRQGELNQKLKQLEDFYSNPEKRKIPTEVYVEALEGVFGKGNLELMNLPDFDDLDDEYFAERYPKAQREKDSKRGLICRWPLWWREKGERNLSLFIHAMKREMKKLQEAGYTKIATETILKPNLNIDVLGHQYYGTIAGQEAGQDSLLPIIKEVFGAEQDSRQNLSWNQIYKMLLPVIKNEIILELTKQGLVVPDFEVIITPALISRELMEKHPLLSRTTTSEWASTILNYTDIDGQSASSSVDLGNSDSGGAGDLGWAFQIKGKEVGFRISILFKK